MQANYQPPRYVGTQYPLNRGYPPAGPPVSAPTRWWLAPAIAIPLGAFTFAAIVALAWFWMFTVPLSFVLASISVAICLAFSGRYPNARFVGIGFMGALAPIIFVGIAFAVAGH